MKSITHYIRNFSLVLGALSILAIPIQTSAATFISDDKVTIDTEETNLYVTGETIEVNAIINKDLVAAGQSIEVNELVSGSLFAAGETIEVNSRVNGNVRIAGRSITLEGTYEGDVLLAGEEVTLNNAEINGDLVLGSAELNIEGETRILGDSYVSSDIDEDSLNEITSGAVNFSEADTEVSKEDKIKHGAQTLFGFLLIMIAITWFLYSKKRIWTPSVGLNLNMIVHFVVGILSFVAVGVGLVLLSIISGPTAFIGILFFVLNFILFGLSVWYIPVYTNNLISNTLKKAWPAQRPWLSTLGIWLMLIILAVIAPFTGPLSILIGLFFTIIALSTHGFLIVSVYSSVQEYLKEPREKSLAKPMKPAPSEAEEKETEKEDKEKVEKTMKRVKKKKTTSRKKKSSN